MTYDRWKETVQSFKHAEEGVVDGEPVRGKEHVVLEMSVEREGVETVIESVREIQSLYPTPRELEELLSNGGTHLRVGERTGSYIHLSDTGPIHSFVLEDSTITVYMGAVDVLWGLPAHLAYIQCLVEWNTEQTVITRAVCHTRYAYIQSKDLKLLPAL